MKRVWGLLYLVYPAGAHEAVIRDKPVSFRGFQMCKLCRKNKTNAASTHGDLQSLRLSLQVRRRNLNSGVVLFNSFGWRRGHGDKQPRPLITIRVVVDYHKRCFTFVIGGLDWKGENQWCDSSSDDKIFITKWFWIVPFYVRWMETISGVTSFTSQQASDRSNGFFILRQNKTKQKKNTKTKLLQSSQLRSGHRWNRSVKGSKNVHINCPTEGDMLVVRVQFLSFGTYGKAESSREMSSFFYRYPG